MLMAVTDDVFNLFHTLPLTRDIQMCRVHIDMIGFAVFAGVHVLDFDVTTGFRGALVPTRYGNGRSRFRKREDGLVQLGTPRITALHVFVHEQHISINTVVPRRDTIAYRFLGIAAFGKVIIHVFQLQSDIRIDAHFTTDQHLRQPHKIGLYGFNIIEDTLVGVDLFEHVGEVVNIIGGKA